MSDLLKKLGKPLSIEQVDFRIQSISEKGFATILAYKDARVDMNRLDEVCDVYWQDDYKMIDGQLYCGIGIKIDNEWVWRWDVGIESNTEKVKGRASDAFKRAGFRWGIGRELYDYPMIQMMLPANEFTVKEYQGKKKGQATYDLKLKDWKWSAEIKDDKLVKLEAVDDKGRIRFDSTKNFNGVPSGSAQPQAQPQTQTPSQPVQQSNPTNQESTEKKWLNKMTKDRKEFTKQWLNVVNGVQKGTIATVDDVRKHYKVSKETEAELNNLINLTTAN